MGVVKGSEFKKEGFSFEPGIYQGKEIIWISFPYNQQLIEYLKSHLKVHWSSSNKKWYVMNTRRHRELFAMDIKYFSNATISSIATDNQPALIKFIEHLQLKGYSTNTINTYVAEFVQLLKVIQHHSVNDLSAEKLRAYFLYCINTLKLSENLIHSRMNAVKFYFEQVLHREKMFFDIPRPKKPSLLPKAISIKDIQKMLAAIDNLKHQLLIKLCYGMGLRVSELVNIKISDIDSNRMQVLVNSGKGKKDRYVALPESVLEDLRTYYATYKPKEYLFEGQFGGQYAVRSAQMVFKDAMKKASIRKKVGIHGLRHSYATHLLEYGTDISIIQKLLGHNHIKTTLIYTQVSNTIMENIKSPLDRIK